MDPVTILAAISAALDLADKLTPLVTAMANQGTITPEQQAAVKAKADEVRAKLQFDATGKPSFVGPEWQA